MSESLQRRLLERELELMTYFALGIASDLGGPQEPADAQILGRTFLSVVLKLSRLLWPHGGRAGDGLAVAEAAELRADVGLTEASPLSPGSTAPLAEALRLGDEAFRRAFDPTTLTLSLGDGSRPLRPAVEAIRAVKEGVDRRTDG
jgi:hypothetical protein